MGSTRTSNRTSKPRFFASRAAFRTWLEGHHAESDLLVVGFYKKTSGKPSMTPQQAVDEALCFGWIDSIRRTLDDDSYEIRFTPRKAGSAWSLANIERAKELIARGLMRPAGLRAFEHHDAEAARSAHERRHAPVLDESVEREFRRNERAWVFFEQQAPSYRRLAIYWVVSAKREETRRTRLATLIDDSAHGRTIKAWPGAPETPVAPDAAVTSRSAL
jgi:uncharacterized protein YdeI (YjbR/CyaY-like superfamily)